MTSRPARAHTSAMPEPIRPQPTTPTRSIWLIRRSSLSWPGITGRRAAARREDSRRAGALNLTEGGRSVRDIEQDQAAAVVLAVGPVLIAPFFIALSVAPKTGLAASRMAAANSRCEARILSQKAKAFSTSSDVAGTWSEKGRAGRSGIRFLLASAQVRIAFTMAS